MATVMFQHEHIDGGKPLVVRTGADEISWAYQLNIAKFPTYGGEVVQLLSVFVDDLKIAGTVRSYKEAEAIYGFFMQYFVTATQGPVANADVNEHFSQQPMIMTYEERQWQIEIQPLHAPGFIYSRETVAPKWQVQSHIVDTGLDVESLRELALGHARLEEEVRGNFKLTGIISPASADPATNPFIAPVTPSTKLSKTGKVEFNPLDAKEVTAGLSKIADYYSNLLPTYMKGDFSALVNTIGSKPVYGRPSDGTETPDELIPKQAKKQK